MWLKHDMNNIFPVYPVELSSLIGLKGNRFRYPIIFLTIFIMVSMGCWTLHKYKHKNDLIKVEITYLTLF